MNQEYGLVILSILKDTGVPFSFNGAKKSIEYF